jgi:acetyl esterase/lipase
MRSLVLLVMFAAAAPFAAAANAPTPGTGTFSIVSNIEYASPGGTPLLMDLRVPDGPGPHPVILYLHSGGWITGDRFGGPAIRQASRGYAIASIDYRLAPRYVWPAQIEDCKAAIRWLRANAARYHLDSEHIGVFGTSAGGHLAAVLGTSGGDDSLEGVALGNAQFSSRVQAVIDLYGPTDLLKMDEQKLPCSNLLDGNASFMPPSLLMGCPIQSCQVKTMTANPITYVTNDDPPFLIMQGLLDCLVPWRQSQLLHDALRETGVASQLVFLPTAQHSDKQFDEQKYQQMVSDFLDANLRGETSVMLRRRVARR